MRFKLQQKLMNYAIKLWLALLVLVSGLTACQSTASDKADITAFVSLVENTFETPAEGAENNIRDRRVRIVSDALDGVWFYTQLNTGPERKLYRQRISNLSLSQDEGAIIQKTYGLNQPEKYVDAWDNPELLGDLKRTDFKSYFDEGCEQIWRPQADGSWLGYVDPKSCVISSKRRNKDIRIESEGFLSKDIYRTNERGYAMDMTFLWGTQPGEYIDLFPVH